jgi:putative flippase GtrA
MASAGAYFLDSVQAQTRLAAASRAAASSGDSLADGARSDNPPMASSTGIPARLWALFVWLQRIRYVKFGLVGASGTVINLAVLWVAQHALFAGVTAQTWPTLARLGQVLGMAPDKLNLLFALPLAILVATISNFTWNRLWTWGERRNALDADLGAPQEPRPKRLVVQFGRYCLASWFGMVFQFAATIWLAHSMHALAANVLSIVAASVINFLANDWWTFRVRGRAQAQGAAPQADAPAPKQP